MHEGARAAGPLSALWFAVFALPLFLFTPDQPRQMSVTAAVRSGLATLADSLRSLRRDKDMAWFLVANMIYMDALVAIFSFGGIYAAGVLGWRTIEIGIYGLVVTVTAALGAYVGGKLDDRLGPKRVIIGSLVLLVVTGISILSIDREHIGFFFRVEPAVAGAGLYSSISERFYMALGILVGLAGGPLQAASRTLLVRLAPADRITQFFGMLALSGRATSFLGPLLVASITAAFASQRLGMSVLLLFFAMGAVLIAPVRLK